MSCSCQGCSALALQWHGVCCAVGGTPGCHLQVGWGHLSQPGCGDSTPPGWSFPFPAETGWENASHGNVMPGRKVLMVSWWLSQLGLCPLSPFAMALGLSLCGEGAMQRDRQGQGRASATSGELPGW